MLLYVLEADCSEYVHKLKVVHIDDYGRFALSIPIYGWT